MGGQPKTPIVLSIVYDPVGGCLKRQYLRFMNRGIRYFLQLSSSFSFAFARAATVARCSLQDACARDGGNAEC